MNYCDNGYVLKKQFFDEQERKLWEAGASYLKEIPEIINGPMKYFEKSQIDGQIILNRVEKFCEFLPLLDQLIRGDKIKELIKEATGKSYLLFKEKINYKLSGGGGFKPHQDGAAFRKFVDNELVTIVIPIQVADENNGCFRISKQKYRPKLIPHSNGSIDSPEYTEDDSNWLSINMNPGDILCFSSYLIHQSKDNLSNLDRNCYFITYSPKELGDQRAKYFAFKREKFPPRIERDKNTNYEGWRKKLAREII